MSESNNVLVSKSYEFSLRIIKLYKYLINKNEYVIAKQILRSGTSIGANIFEAQRAQSKKDFLAKLYISYKEGGETEYWLKLLRDSDYLSNEQCNSMLNDLIEINKILTTSIKTLKTNLGL